MKEKEFVIEDLEKQIRAMPKMEQRAVCWLIKNIDTVEELTAGEKIEESEIKRLIKTALEKDDHVMLALALYKRVRTN